jgi:hypothetical protein
MNFVASTVRLTASCDFCGTSNELTILDAYDHQPVSCSTCGGSLGTVADLWRPSEGEKNQGPLVDVATSKRGHLPR